MKTLVLALLIPVAICAGCTKKEETYATAAPAPMDPAPTAPVAGAATGATPATAHVSLTSAAGSTVKGDLTLTNENTEEGSGISISGEITGLAPGTEHGFHVHETGECSLPDFKSAGAHFNPTNDPHGGPKSKPRHLGDIQNVTADENGRASFDVRVKGATLGDTDDGPAQIRGKALVVHAMPDDYKTQPSGDSGARIACGVIR